MKIKKIYLITASLLLSNGSMALEENNMAHDHELFIDDDATIKMNLLKNVETKKIFVCPMHPEIIQHEEGDCPICGMDLVEKNKVSGTNIDEVVISNGMQQNLNIKTSKAKMKRLTPKIKSYGKIRYNEDTIVHKHLRVDGWIENSFIKKEGQYVEKGDKVFEVYSEDLIVAQQNLILTKTTKSSSKSLIERAKKRLKLLGISDGVISDVLKSGEVKYTVPFYAKKSGYIRDYNIRDGMYVSSATKLYSVVDQSSFWVDGYVFENNKDSIKPESKVVVTLSNGLIYNSKVDYIYPELDEKTLAFKYRAVIENNNRSMSLKPNMIVNLELSSTKKIMGLFVPLESLIQTENQNRIIIKTKKGFVAKEVVVGFKNEKQAQILKGLSLNDDVVVSGQFLIDSEASLSGSLLRIEGVK